MFEQLDTDGDGQLQYTEFLAAALSAQRGLREDVAWAAFQRFDRDGDGAITAEELSAAVGVVGGEDGGAVAAVCEADRDGDGTVSFEEFLGLLRGAPLVCLGIS